MSESSVSTPVEATPETFRDLVAEGTVLVDVWGPRCRECLALRPHVERIAADRDLRLVMLEAPKTRQVCVELRVMAMPTLLLFAGGQEVARVTGQDLTPTRVEEWLDAATPGALSTPGSPSGDPATEG
jgi:thioredoxin-like negative regulator of GroEL